MKVYPRERGKNPNGMPIKLSEFRSGKHPRLKARSDIQERYRTAVSEISKLGSLDINKLRDLLMDPARGYNVKSANAYHFTPLERLASILSEGLKPRTNQNLTKFSERDLMSGRIPTSVSRGLPRVFVEIAEEKPSGQNLPVSLWNQKLGLVSFPIEEALKRLSREDAFKILAMELGEKFKYPIHSNPISRRIIRSRTGIDPQAGANPARGIWGLNIPEWALSEPVPANLLTRRTNVNPTGREW